MERLHLRRPRGVDFKTFVAYLRLQSIQLMAQADTL
jgi:hypothetical protein